MIALLLLGYFPFKRVAETAPGSREERLFRYTLVLLFIRLVRFILRFISGFTLMTIAVVSWFRRKRIVKGRLEPPQPPGFGYSTSNEDNDGILLVGLNQQLRYHKASDAGRDTPQWERVSGYRCQQG